MLAIESGLSSRVEADVLRVNPMLPDIIDHITAAKPRVVIIEQYGTCSQLALEILRESIPLIVLDEARRSILVLTREHAPKAGIGELTGLIEEIMRRPEDLPEGILPPFKQAQNS
jgi:hypothetical protein